ncbi:unnamed protein product [Urochloa decumbens]|uniref:Uncharacterized protein n=1 Tax=Urochloa decumbens TaxID=240449 RepID=A0ABC8WBS2_9POAL
MEYKARRRHVPAFGEWNYYSASSSPEEEPQRPPYSGGAAVVSAECGSAAAPWWYAAAAEPEACSDAWFRYSPPPRSTRPKKARRPAAAVPVAAEAEKKLPCYSVGAAVLSASEARAARASAVPAKRRVVRPVDADLYRVPTTPDDTVVASRRPRPKRAARSLWMGCLGGFNCVA